MQNKCKAAGPPTNAEEHSPGKRCLGACPSWKVYRIGSSLQQRPIAAEQRHLWRKSHRHCGRRRRNPVEKKGGAWEQHRICELGCPSLRRAMDKSMNTRADPQGPASGPAACPIHRWLAQQPNSTQHNTTHRSRYSRNGSCAYCMAVAAQSVSKQHGERQQQQQQQKQKQQQQQSQAVDRKVAGRMSDGGKTWRRNEMRRER